eukprot:g10241.t1
MDAASSQDVIEDLSISSFEVEMGGVARLHSTSLASSMTRLSLTLEGRRHVVALERTWVVIMDQNKRGGLGLPMTI